MADRPFEVNSSAEQVYGHLRGMIAGGRLRGVLPGVLRMEAEFGMSRRALMAAVDRLEKEGWVAAAGPGRRRRIVESAIGTEARRGLRVVMLAYDEGDRRRPVLLEVLHQLHGAGHTAVFADRSLVEMGMDAGRVAALVERSGADAWLVVAGSGEVLEWFSRSGRPVFAIFGRQQEQPIAGAGPDLAGAMERIADRLIDLGHRRIVLLVRRERRLPRPGPPENAFLGKLAARGIPVSPYSLPDWADTAKGFQQSLESLFQVTPPTALVLGEPSLYLAALHFLNARRQAVPGDVSLVCMDSDPVFAWSNPPVARIEWDSHPLVRAASRWVKKLAAGKDDHTKTPIKAEFIEGATLGSAPGA